MRSTDRHRGQRGVSLIESVVASALLGIAVVAGLTAWDTASLGARAATQRAWANCVGRSYMEAALATAGTGQPAHPSYVTIDPVPVVTDSSLLKVTVLVRDPTSQAILYRDLALKAPSLSGFGSPNQSQLPGQIAAGCPSP